MWTTPYAVVGDASVGPLRLGEALALDLAEDGRMQRLRPHMRPWPALTLLALRLGPRIGRHPPARAAALRRR